MSFTIGKMLQLKEFDGCKLVAGTAGIHHVIDCVDTMEVPNIEPWIKKNELLITTGYSIINRMDLLMGLLDTLYKNDSAGLAIKTRFIGPLPQAVIDRANVYQLPIIEMPDDTPFIPLIHAISNCIADEQHNLLLFSLSISKRFSDIQQSENFFLEISEIIHGLMDLPVIITDFLLTPYIIYPKDTCFSDLRDSERVQEFHQVLAALDNQAVRQSRQPGDPSFILQKIFINGILAGYMFLPFPEETSREIDATGKILLNQAARSLALYLSDFGVLNSQRRQQDIMLYKKLLKGDLVESRTIRYWTAQCDWPSPPISLLTFETSGPLHHSFGSSDSVNLQIMWVVRSLLYNDGISCAVIPQDDHIRCMISTQPKNVLRQSLSRILNKIQTDLSLKTVVSVSLSLGSYSDLPAAHEEAFHTLKIAQSLGEQIAFTQDLFFELSLLCGADNHYLCAFAHNVLDALIKYDQQNKTSLLKTLQELVNHMGIHTQTAQALYLHRNTLLYRIHRIELITGLNLSLSDDLYKAAIALRIYSLLDMK